MNTVIKFIKWLREGVISSLFFCLRGSRTNRTLVRAKGEDHSFADDFSAAEISLLAKYGQAKIAVGNFFGAFIRADFFESTFVGRKSSEFFEPRGSKKGCNP